MEKDNKFLSEFKRTLGKRIATTPNAYEDNSWSYRRATRVKDYSLEEVKNFVYGFEKLIVWQKSIELAKIMKM